MNSLLELLELIAVPLTIFAVVMGSGVATAILMRSLLS